MKFLELTNTITHSLHLAMGRWNMSVVYIVVAELTNDSNTWWAVHRSVFYVYTTVYSMSTPQCILCHLGVCCCTHSWVCSQLQVCWIWPGLKWPKLGWHGYFPHGFSSPSSLLWLLLMAMAKFWENKQNHAGTLDTKALNWHTITSTDQHMSHSQSAVIGWEKRLQILTGVTTKTHWRRGYNDGWKGSQYKSQH